MSERFTAAHAVWLDDDEFLYVTNESRLWKYDLTTGKSDALFQAPHQPTDRGSFAKAPVVSRSRELVAWGYPIDVDGVAKLETIVIDMRRGEYRRIDGWWHAVNILEAEE